MLPTSAFRLAARVPVRRCGRFVQSTCWPGVRPVRNATAAATGTQADGAFAVSVCRRSLSGRPQRAVVTEFANTADEGLERVVVEDCDPPDTSTLKPTDVVVSVRSAGLSWVDLIMTSGQYQHAPRLPYVPGMEYAGDVAWVGDEAAKHHQVGDRVVRAPLAVCNVAGMLVRSSVLSCALRGVSPCLLAAW